MRPSSGRVRSGPRWSRINVQGCGHRPVLGGPMDPTSPAVVTTQLPSQRRPTRPFCMTRRHLDRVSNGWSNSGRTPILPTPVATVSNPPPDLPAAISGRDPLAPFSPAVRAWFESSFAAPTQAQAEGWAAIADGHHTLIHAPTGSGKTLAAFLWTLDRLAASPPRPAPTKQNPGSIRVLYISPAQGADLRRRAEPAGTARRDRPGRRPTRRAGPRHHRREPDRRHPGR